MKRYGTRFAFLAVVVTVSLAVPFLSLAYADQNDPALTHYGLAGASFIVAGLYYSSMGWVAKIRKALSSDDAKIDWGKMGKSVMVGIFLGVAAFVAMEVAGEDAISISTPQEFFTQVGINSAAILAVDKLLLGRAPKDQSIKANDNDASATGTTGVTDLPPGKDVV